MAQNGHVEGHNTIGLIHQLGYDFKIRQNKIFRYKSITLHVC
jgi:hypothetical protein